MGIEIHRNRKIALAGAIAVMAIAGAIVVGQNAHTTSSNQAMVSLSLAKSYNTLAELRRDAEVVVLVSVEGVPTPSKRFGYVPSVDVQLRVERVFAGTVQIGDNITLAQIGDPSGQIKVTEPIPPILQNGKRYVVYLNRQFPDQPQMCITGQSGVFEADSSGAFQRLGDANPELPKKLSLDQF